MFVYANYPVIHTDLIFSALSEQSEDPVTQVVCLAFDKETKYLSGYGVNRVLRPFKTSLSVQAVVATPKADAKKFLMVHAEQDFLNKQKDTLPHVIVRTGIFLSLQPCMACLAALIDAGYTDIQWLEDNRHQEEQQLIKPFLNIINYRKNVDGLHLQVPSWIIK